MKYTIEEIKTMLEEADNDGMPLTYPHAIIRDLLAENERLSALAAQQIMKRMVEQAEYLADQELLIGRERKKVAGECIDYVNNHANDCGCSKRIAHDIRSRYGVD